MTECEKTLEELKKDWILLKEYKNSIFSEALYLDIENQCLIVFIDENGIYGFFHRIPFEAIKEMGKKHIDDIRTVAFLDYIRCFYENEFLDNKKDNNEVK